MPLPSRLLTQTNPLTTATTRLTHLSPHLRTMTTAPAPAPLPPPLAIIAGVGPGTGASLARKFSQHYRVVVLARNPSNYDAIVHEINSSATGPAHALGISADVADAGSVGRAFEAMEREYGGEMRVAAGVFNVGGRFIRKPFLELREGEFESGWEANGRGAFHFSRALLPHLLCSASLSPPPAHPPSLLFTGATASVKGSALCASFATGKFALRALAQSLAREFGPKGVHVAHVVVDGVIDIPRTREWVLQGEDAKLSADAIADAYWHLHTQPRTTWTHELDLRPYIEKW